MKRTFIVLAVLFLILGIAVPLQPQLRNKVLLWSGISQEQSKVYKWKDANGDWHITDTRPQSGVQYIEQEYLHRAHVVPRINTE